MKGYARWIVGAAVALLLAFVGTELTARHSAELAVARAEADSAQAASRTALSAGRAALTAASEYKAAYDLASNTAHAEKLRGDSATSRASIALAAYRTLRAAAPDTCHTVTAAADVALESDSLALVARTAENSALHKALLNQQKRADTLSAALPIEMAATGRADGALTNLTRASKPSLTRFLPHLGAGVALGVDATGAPHTVIGITFGWTF